jgi:hypothetical protein
MNAIEPCPQCGRAPDPRAARLVTIDMERAAVAARIEAARRTFAELTRQWQALSAERDDLARRIYAAVAGERAAAQAAARAQVPPVERERQGATQNLLFVIGGILLGVGAIVFTIVAWSRYGMTGRTVILGSATAVAFAIPVLAVRRGLRATAETFAAIGLLLVVLDGFGVWRLDALGVRAIAAPTYAGLVLAVVVAVAAGFGALVRLTGPRFVALVAAQPVFSLLIASHRPTSAGVAVAFTLTAVCDLLAARYLRPRAAATAVVASVFAGITLLIAALAAFTALITPQAFGGVLEAAGAVCLTAAVLLVVASRVSARDPRNLLVAIAMLEVVPAVARPVRYALHGQTAFVVAGVTAGAVAVALVARRWARFAAGTRVAAWCVAGATGLASSLLAAVAAARYLSRLRPVWHSDLGRLAPGVLGAGVAVAIAVAFVGAALLAAAGRRRWVTLLGAAPLAVAAGLLYRVAWWTPPVVAEAGAAALVVIAAVHLRRELTRAATVAAAGAGALVAYAAVGSSARPASTAAALAGIAVIGWVATALLRRDRIVSGIACVIALVAAPFAVVSGAAALVSGPVVPMRAGLVAVAVEVVALFGLRGAAHLRGYAVGAIAAVTIAISVDPLFVRSDERVNLYAMTGRLLIGLAVLAIGMRGRSARVAMIPGDVLGLLALGRIAPVATTVLIAPYAWSAHLWRGAPDAVGISPTPSSRHLDVLDIVTAVLFAASLVTTGAAMRGRRGAYAAGVPTGTLAVLVALAALGVAWPGVPVVSLTLGLGAVLAGALPRTRSAVVAWSGLAFAGAGLAGLLATRDATLCGLGAAVVVAVVVGAAGAGTGARAAGWCAAVVSADLLAVVVADGRGGLREVSFGLLAASTIAALAAPVVRRRSRSGAEPVAYDAAVHGGLLVALLLAGGGVRAAIVACAWGVLVAVRAATAGRRRIELIVCAGLLECVAWWLLLGGRGVGLVDAYTVPFAAYAYAVGIVVRRRRPATGSWIAFGPALLAGFLPSLALALGPDPSVVRRLAVGGAAVVAVLVGARFRLRAQVVVAGAVAIVLALRELVLAWQHLPAWIPLTGAGLLVIAVASTYERRRRDWTRLRASLRDMV